MKKYGKRFQESIKILNKDHALTVIEDVISYLYGLYEDDLKADKLVALGIYRALERNDDAKSNMLMINKFVRELESR